MSGLPVEKHDSPVAIDKVLRLESEMLKLDQVELPVAHYFSKGVYARELFIPKGVTLTGKIHKFTNMNIMTKGEMSVSTDSGVQRVKAPFIIVSPPGTKRVAYAHEDTIWITIHGTEETDVEKIEHEFVASTHEEYLSFCETMKLKGD